MAFQYDLQLGVILAAFGAAVLIRADGTLSYVCQLLSAAVLVDGTFKTAIALDAKKFGIKPWYAILTAAIAACITGAALLLCPADNVRAVTALTGTTLITEGILHLIVILSTVKVIRHQLPDNLSDKDN